MLYRALGATGLFLMLLKSLTAWGNSDNPYDAATYEPKVEMLEQRLKTACANEVPGENRSLLARSLLSEAEKNSKEVRLRIEAIHRFQQDPEKGAREEELNKALKQRGAIVFQESANNAKKEALAQRLESKGQSRDLAQAQKTRLEIAQSRQNLARLKREKIKINIDDASKKRIQKALVQSKADLNGLSKVAIKLDLVTARSEFCYYSSLHEWQKDTPEKRASQKSGGGSGGGGGGSGGSAAEASAAF